MSDEQTERIQRGEAILVSKKQLFVSFIIVLILLITTIAEATVWKSNVDFSNESQDKRLSQVENIISQLQNNESMLTKTLIEIELNQKILMQKLGVKYIQNDDNIK